MSLRSLLNTNIISDLVRRPRAPVASRIAEIGEDSICTRIVVAAELRYGAEKQESKQLCERVDLLLSALEILPPALPADRRYAELGSHFTRQGTPHRPEPSVDCGTRTGL